MPVEKITQVGQAKQWYGGLTDKYGEAFLKSKERGLYGQYTYGLAGEKFFREIKDNGRIMGAKCEKCNLLYLPPRIYCEQCFSELGEWQEIAGKGMIHTYTAAYVDLDGARLSEPVLLALVKFPGVYGGLVHRLGEMKPEEVEIGMPVEIVLKPKTQRIGSILDIKYFKPA